MKRRDAVTELELGQVLTFMQQIWALVGALQSRSKFMKARVGLTGPQRRVLRIVQRFPGMSPGDLGRVLRIHKSTLAGILSRLEEQKLIRREHDPSDARRYFLHLTAVGRKRLSAQTGTSEAIIRRVLATLSEDQHDKAVEVIGKLVNALSVKQ